MLRIFRNIRRRLLSDGKFSKYLLYAIGEITLVVIGILIALAINNWREKNIIQKREEYYLYGIKDEFEQNKLKLQNLLSVNRLNYENSKKMAVLVRDSADLPDESEISKMLYNSFYYGIAYYPNNSMLNELINSGRLEDISNPILRKHLTAWEPYIQGVRFQEKELSIQRDKVLDLFRGNNASIRTILDQTGSGAQEMGLSKDDNVYSNLEVVKSREFENNLLIFILTGIATEKSQYEPLLEEINTILQLINDEIEN